MSKQRFPNFGKVALAVFEAKVEDVIGKDAIKEIKTPLIQKDLHEALVKALANAEERLIAEFSDNDISTALDQLPISSLRSLELKVWEFYENPLSANIQEAIQKQIELVAPQDIDTTKLAEVASNYFQYFREEAALIPELSQTLASLSSVKTEYNTSRIADAIERLEKLEEAKQVRLSSADYDNYLKFLISDLKEWQKRYAPMFAKFKSLTLFARIPEEENKDPQELLQLVRKNKKLAIIGPAGSGKTTTLKKVAVDYATNYLKRKSKSHIPIIVSLRDYGAVDLKSIISSIIKSWGLSFESIEQDLLEGKFLVIFDGLNEVPPSIRKQCFQEIRSFTKEYRPNKFLYTSRNFEYQDDWISIDEKSVLVCEIEPLNKEQIEDCVRRYFGRKKNFADKLIDELKIHDLRVWENRKSLARLAGTPLLLQMLILTFEERRRIPKSEGELMLGFVDEILFRIEPTKSASEFTPEVKKYLLSTIAWEMHKGMLSSIEKRHAFSVFLKRLDELKKSGQANVSYDANQIWQELKNNYLLIDDGSLVYWPHPLYQELFVGLSLRDRCFKDNWEPNYTEIYIHFRPIEAKFGSGSFESGLRMLEVVPQLSRFNALAIIATVNPSLAKEAFLLFEPEHNPGMMDEFSKILRENLLSSNWEGESHRNLLLTASFISPNRFCSLFNDSATMCPSTKGREQALSFLWSSCERSVSLETIKKSCAFDPEPNVRRTAFNILIRSGETHDNEMYSFFVERMFEESQGFLSDSQLLLQKLLDLEFIINLLVDIAKHENDFNKTLRAIWCLGKSQINNLTARKLLINFAKKDDKKEIKREAVVALGAYPAVQTIKTLGDLVNDDRAKSVRIEAINSLYTLGDVKTLPSIISALNDNEDGVVENAVSTLVKYSKKENKVVDLLLEYLKKAGTKSKILLTLSQIVINETAPLQQTEICKELSYNKNERDKNVRLEIALALRNYDLTISNEILRELSNDRDKAIRDNAQEVLDEWGIEL